MKLTKEMMRLYAVTDRSWLRGQTLCEQVEKALIGGATLVQLREKELDEAAFLREAVQMAKLCHRYGVPLLINDNVDIARRSGADFIKTSTGFGTGGATVEDIALMRKAVGSKLGVKASGGIRDYATAKAMIEAGATRIGASAGVAIVKEEQEACK